ncbi:MAG TPA: hypothetical protein VE397_07565 [Stellaceae bacterium]|nr:hypothetical protein [Stellaceae bacterium]
MILTPIESDRLPALLQRFAAALGTSWTRQVFARIARPEDAARAAGPIAARHRREALALARRFGMGVRAGSPTLDVSWDGAALRADTEAYVLLHEVAHFQLASPERRRCTDFGLGPGPETGDRAAAVRAASLFGLAAEREEAMASLLGILWEASLGHPALASFLDQNWLEGAERPGTAEHFRTTLAALAEGGFVSEAGRPTFGLRSAPDTSQYRALCGPAKWM